MWVISFLIFASPSRPVPLSHTRPVYFMLLLLLCRQIKFDEFFKRNFFNYQINAVEYFSKCALRKLKMPKTQKRTQSDTPRPSMAATTTTKRRMVEEEEEENEWMKGKWRRIIYTSMYVYYFRLFLFARNARTLANNAPTSAKKSDSLTISLRMYHRPCSFPPFSLSCRTFAFRFLSAILFAFA